MKLITSTHYNRPHCTQQMIDHLYRCEKIKEYHVVFFIEPGCKQVADIIERCTLNKTIHYNDRLLGCWTNKKQALDIGFESADFVIHLEDDVLLSPDALFYFEWARKNAGDDIATITAYSRFNLEHYIESNANTRSVRKRPWYNSTAWSIELKNYKKLDNWTGEDKNLLEQLHKALGMFELYPVLSRANNIGHCNGVQSHAIDILKVVGDNAYAPIGLSRNGLSFVSDKQAYLDRLLQQEKNPIIRAQIEKCQNEDFDTQLITNSEGDEYVKLNDNKYKSRNNWLYEQQYHLTTWAGSLKVLETEFEND